MQRAAQSFGEPLLGNCPVAHLRPLAVGDDPHGRSESCDQSLPLALVECGRGLDVERQLCPGGRLVRVLAAGTAGRAEPNLQFVTWDPNGVGHDQAVIVFAGRHETSVPVLECDDIATSYP